MVLIKATAAGACLVLGVGCSATGANAACSAAPSAVIPQGTIKGFRDAHCNSVYLGIPFAATTGGKNRWHPPQDVRPSTSQVEAVSYGATCPQAKVKKQYSRQGEDCLNLNIWAPPDARKSSALPVFVFMYGGAMVTGSNSNPQLQGTNFARKDVIYVNFNTRESIFAYPHSSEIDEAYPGQSQNLGILDVNKALEWVHSNIRAFGGNPDHIVFGGHSSGSVQVDHYLWNHPDTWLKGAVQMSANAMSGPAYAPMDEAMDAVAAEVGCPAAGNRQLECLRKVDIYTLETAMFNSTLNTWFTPVIDDITRHADYAFRFNQGKYPSHVSLLTGTADKEGNIFSLVYGKAGNFSSWINTFDADCAHIPDCVLRGAYKDLDSESRRIGTQYGDARFNCPVDYLIDMRSGTQSTWVYRFFGKYDNVVGPPNTAPTHGTEVPFFHGGHECFDSLEGVTSEQQALADFTHDWFVAWIKNPAAGPGWAKASPGSGPLVKLGMPGANTELTRVDGSTADYNALCKKVYAPAFPKYPVVQSGWAGTR